MKLLNKTRREIFTKTTQQRICKKPNKDAVEILVTRSNYVTF